MLFVINCIKLHLTAFKSVHQIAFLHFMIKKIEQIFLGTFLSGNQSQLNKYAYFFYFVEVKKWIEFYDKNILYMDMLYHSLSNPITNCNYVTLAQKSLRCEVSCMLWILLEKLFFVHNFPLP